MMLMEQPQQAQILLPQTTQPSEEIPPALLTAAIYFCFYDDKFDKPEHPNKLILARPVPTVADVCSTMKALFFTGQDVVLTCTFMVNNSPQEYTENCQNPVPTTERSNVILIKSRYQEGASKITPHSIQVAQFLQQNNLDSLELISIFQKQKITLDNMKYLKDTDLQNFGIGIWETRMAILEAIQKYYMPLAVAPAEMDSPPMQNSDDDMSPRDLKRLRMSGLQQNGSSKKFKGLSDKRPNSKDLEVLVNEHLIPVQEGTPVYCEGSNIRGLVVINEEDKPFIEYVINGKKRTGNLSQYYKAATGNLLQSKDDSMSKIFFHDPTIGGGHSLQEFDILLQEIQEHQSRQLY